MAEFDKLLIMRVLRPDRLTAAMTRFVAGVLGPDLIASQAFDLERSFQVCTLRRSQVMWMARMYPAATQALASLVAATHVCPYTGGGATV